MDIECRFTYTGSHGQITAICSNCDEKIWWNGWYEYIDKNRQIIKILCRECYEND